MKGSMILLVMICLSGLITIAQSKTDFEGEEERVLKHEQRQQTCPRCTALCKNGDGSLKVCGNDGCGGSCGTCNSGQQCCNGVCVCQPNCQGRSCGDDGCGGQSCGQCSSTQTCVNGQCTGTASRTCSGRVCGNDRAGGSCGSCTSGQRCREGQCECFYDCNERNCGDAIQPTGVNTALCPPRSCGTCPKDFTCGTNGLCSALQSCSIIVQVTDCSTNIPIGFSSTVVISSSSLSYSSTLTIGASSSGTWSAPSTGSFNFQVTPSSGSGYLSKTEIKNVALDTTQISVCLNRPNITITVVDCSTLVGLSVSSTVQISSSSYFTSISVAPSGTSFWTLPSSGSFTFQTTASSGYPTKTEVRTVTETTSSIQICLDRSTIIIRVLDCSTLSPLNSVSTVLITGTSSSSYSFTLTVPALSSTGVSWTAPSFGSFNFVTSTSVASYISKTETRTISSTTTSIDLCLSQAITQIDVRDKTTNKSITVTTDISFSGGSSSSSSVSGSFVWNGISTWVISGGYGTYTFFATPRSVYSKGNLTISVTQTTTLIIIYVSTACGDGVCTLGVETNNNCPVDCASVLLQFENAVATGGVFGFSVNFYLQNPRDQNSLTGPERNNVPIHHTTKAGSSSFSLWDGSLDYDITFYIEVIKENFITFYFQMDTYLSPGFARYLRSHLSPVLQSDELNYRIVNTWTPDTAVGFESPTSLTMVAFFPHAPLDPFKDTTVNDTTTGNLIGKVVVNSVQSGGPATFDLDPKPGDRITIWNAKPPRNTILYPNQNSRALKNSGSFIVLYGRTSNSHLGKQLGVVFIGNAVAMTESNDLWYAADFIVNQAGKDQPQYISKGQSYNSTIASNNSMFFNCLTYSHCSNFEIPYADARK